MKDDPSEPVELLTNDIIFTPGGSNSFGISGEDSIKVDPEGKVSFGDRMAEAIREVQEKGETNGT